MSEPRAVSEAGHVVGLVAARHIGFRRARRDHAWRIERINVQREKLAAHVGRRAAPAVAVDEVEEAGHDQHPSR